MSHVLTQLQCYCPYTVFFPLFLLQTIHSFTLSAYFKCPQLPYVVLLSLTNEFEMNGSVFSFALRVSVGLNDQYVALSS